jgi:glutathione synthase/RimK-type ligase-like ATP-grasp enzyme
LLDPALRARGLEPEWAVWDDPRVEWDRFALVVVRSAWDYAERWSEFLRWAERVGDAVENPLRALRFGVDKERYLTILRDRGVPIVRTSFQRPEDEPFEPWPEPFVVKPAISAGGRRSARFEGADPSAAALVSEIVETGETAMVQPFVADADEVSLVYVDGAFSHSLRRRAALPLGRPAEVLYLEEELGSYQATAAERKVAEAALALVPAPTLYARVDLLGGRLLELEVVEPSLYLSYNPSAADRVGAAIAARLHGA